MALTSYIESSTNQRLLMDNDRYNTLTLYFEHVRSADYHGLPDDPANQPHN